MNLNRRGFLRGVVAAAVAPAIIRTPGLIMPIKPVIQTQTGLTLDDIDRIPPIDRRPHPFWTNRAYGPDDVVEYRNPSRFTAEELTNIMRAMFNFYTDKVAHG